MRRKADRRRLLLWSGLAALAILPLALAAASPLQTGRAPTWVVGGLAGVLALCLLPIQPLLAAGLVGPATGRRAHRWLGLAILLLLIVHVGGLWLYSPEDIVDALLLVAPTPFSVWGVLGVAALVAAGAVAAIGAARRPLPPRFWRPLHLGLAVIGAIAAIAHAWMIDGAMETTSKALLCLAVAVSAGILAARIRLR